MSHRNIRSNIKLPPWSPKATAFYKGGPNTPVFVGRLEDAPRHKDGNRLGLRKRKRMAGFNEHAKMGQTVVL